jgi:hypothetical protein
MLDVENDDEDEDEVESELDPDEGKFRPIEFYLEADQWSSEASDDSEQEYDEDEDEDEQAPTLPGSDRNSQLNVGYKGDRSYVVRGNNIGVFNHSAGNEVKYYATISKIATPKGKQFKPKHVCCTL